MGERLRPLQKLDDLPLDVIGRTVALVPVKVHLANYRAARTGKVK